MKTKFSKRILSLFLAVMMVVTSIPMFALTASAGVDGAKYLFAYFTGNSKYGQQIRFALSEDGYNFTALNNNKPVVQQTKGDSETSSGYARDPYITRDPNGNGFYMVATDMDASEGGIHEDWSGDSCIYVWHSSDLVNWEQISDFDFRSISGFENTIRAWAPQIIWDSAKSQYMMYLSITKDGDWNQMYYTYTSDFKTFTTPVKFEFSDGVKGRIDADIVEINGTYYMYYKDETSAKVLVATSSSLTGTYTYQADVSSSLSSKAVEGNAMYQIGNSSTWVIMLDEYLDGSFAYGTTTDFVNFTKYTGSTANNSFLSARHGSVMQITDAEYQALVEAYKSSAFSTDFSYMFDKSYSGTRWSYSNEVVDGCGHNIVTQATEDGANGSATQNIGNGKCVFNYGRIFINDSIARSIVRSNSFTVSTDVTKTTDDKCLILGLGGMDKDYLQVFSDGTFNVRIGDTFSSATFTPIPTNQTGHYAVCYNGTSTSLYVDGVKVATINGVMDERASASDGSFYTSVGGSDTAGTDALIGTVSSLRFSKYSDYDVALNAAVISTQEAFETKMAEITTDTIYTNIGTAYEAYVNLQKALDAVNYGLRTDVSLSEYIDKLNRAIGSMKLITNGIVSVDNTKSVPWNSGSITDSTYYSNVLWANSSISANSIANSNSMDSRILANSTIVLVNDGNKIKYPVAFMIKNQWGASKSNLKCIIASSTNFNVEQNWVSGTQVHPDNYEWNTTGSSTVSISTSNTSYFTLAYNVAVGDNVRYYFFRNYMTRGNSENTSTYYDLDNSLSYTAYNKNNNTVGSSIGNNVYTINYLTLKNLLNSKYTTDVKNAVINVAKDISQYKEGGAAGILAIADCLVDPTAYDYSSNTASVVQEVAGLLKAKTEKLQGLSVTTTATTDSTNYAKLRSEMDAFGANYSDTQKYTSESLAEYKKIYDASVEIMADVLSNGYTNKDANAALNVIALRNVLNSILDKSTLQAEIANKDNPVIFDESGNQTKTYASWKTVYSALKEAKLLDETVTYRYSTETGNYANVTQTDLKYNKTTTDYAQAVTDATTDLQNANLVDIDTVGYPSFDAAYIVANSIDREKYEDTALEAFDSAKNTAYNSVYYKPTADEMSAYNDNTEGTDITGDLKISTSLTNTDDATTALLNAINTLNSQLKSFVVNISENVENPSVASNSYSYGETVTVSLPKNVTVPDGSAVQWVITKYASTDEMTKGGTPLSSQIITKASGESFDLIADCAMDIQYIIEGVTANTETYVYKIYNAYGNVAEIIYSADPLDTDGLNAAIKFHPILPFYTFTGWTVGEADENGIIKVTPNFENDDKPYVTISIVGNGSYTANNMNDAKTKAVIGTDVTVNADGVYGWAVKKDGKYQIVSYKAEYKFTALTDEVYTAITQGSDGYYVENGSVQLTIDNVYGYAVPIDVTTIDAQAYLNAKLKNSAPFVYYQTSQYVTETDKQRVYVRITAGSIGASAYGLVIAGNKYKASTTNSGGQFYMQMSSSAYEAKDINAYVNYTFIYTDKGIDTTVNTIDYAFVKTAQA